VTTAFATWCWGYNAQGELGNGATTDSSTPIIVGGGLQFASVTAGQYHACGRSMGGTVYCWGNSVDGQLGNGSTASTLAPVRVSGQP
jgi:alpha-tubulin suppressor-like RCC1 family protein